MFFPWSVFLPAGFARVRQMNDGAKLASVWFWVVFVFFSISKTQLVTYIFPLYPAAALFVGVLLDRAASGEQGSEKSVRRGTIAALVFSVLIAVALVKVAQAKYPGVGVGVIAMGAAIVVAAAVAMFSRATRAVVSIGTGMAVFALLLVCAVVPSITPAVSTRDIVRTIGDTNGGRIVNMGLWKPSLLFYLNRNPQRIDGAPRARQMLSEKVPTWVVCKDKDAPLLDGSGSITERMGGLVIVANEAAAKGKGSSVK
jgi:4-amino-4-deoxy-L-arabinose transferase-like glycosyltransferase